MKTFWSKVKAIDWGFVSLILILVTTLAITGIVLAVSLRADKLCLEQGWANSKVTWDLTTYCIREENEYEIVKPLEAILQDVR